jgi:ATP-binding cassette subfamily C (CFTR/MRP) protein 1
MDLGFNFRMIIRAWTDLETSLSAVTRIRQFSKSPSEDQDTTKPDPPESWPKNGSVQFKQIVASYTENGESILSNVNLDIKAGERIGIAGRTGSGKSSFVAAIFGLLHQQNGAILVDNIPTSDISLSRLRSVIVALPQEPFFLKGTVRHNLSPWMPGDNRPSLSDAQMKDALEQVQLWDKLRAATVVEQSALDLNLDHVESLLSQGERQLFCLARAILMDGKIVVLDEATSRYIPQPTIISIKSVRPNIPAVSMPILTPSCNVSFALLLPVALLLLLRTASIQSSTSIALPSWPRARLWKSGLPRY